MNDYQEELRLVRRELEDAKAEHRRVVEQHEMDIDDWRDRYEKADKERAQLAAASRSNAPSEVI